MDLDLHVYNITRHLLAANTNFMDKIVLKGEGHFWINGLINKQNHRLRHPPYHSSVFWSERIIGNFLGQLDLFELFLKICIWKTPLLDVSPLKY